MEKKIRNIKVDYETISVDKESNEKFSLTNYGNNLNKQINYIQDKILEAERKITSLKTKEKIIDDMIDRTNRLVEKYNDEKNYKLSGINSSHILTQFETLSQVQEMLIKYEDMIQKYIKMSIDIENHKINAFAKLNSTKKENEKNDDGYGKIMEAMHELMRSNDEVNIGINGPTNEALLDSVKESLKLEGY